MTSTPPLEIKVIYSSASRRSRRTKSAGTMRIATVSQARRKRAWAGLGMLSLFAAGALCYGIWWRADPYLYVTMVMRTPVSVPGVDLDEAAKQVFGIPAEEAGADGAEPENQGERHAPAYGQVEQSTAYHGDTARNVIVVSVYAWLTLATVACCMVALSGGASLGRAGGGLVRIFGVIAACGGLLALGFIGYQLWGEYGRQFRPTHLRAGYALLVVLTAFVGMVLARGARQLTRLAAAMLIVSAAGSVAGLYFGARAGAVPPEHSTFAFLAMVFIVHSLYGWILLPVSWRIAR